MLKSLIIFYSGVLDLPSVSDDASLDEDADAGDGGGQTAASKRPLSANLITGFDAKLISQPKYLK